LGYNTYIHGNVTRKLLVELSLTNKKVIFFFFYKIRGQKGRQNRFCLRGWYQWEGKGCGERVKEGEYGANTVYTCVKMEK
jgi:hypothetical protein